MQKRVIISSTPSPTFLRIRRPKYLKKLIASLNSGKSSQEFRIFSLKHISILNHFEIYQDDTRKKALYLKFVKQFQKHLKFFKSVSHRFPRFIRRPSIYELDISKKYFWHHFFHLTSLKQLDLYNNDQANLQPNNTSKKIINNIKRHHKCLRSITMINLEGHVLSDFSRKILLELFKHWSDSGSLGSINLKIWDYHRHFFDKESVLESRTYFLKFVNRCGDFNLIGDVLKTNFEFKNIYKLEFWTRISEEKEFKPLRNLKLLTTLKEIRARFEIEGDLADTSRRLLHYISFPNSLEILNLLIVSLRLEWRRDIAEDEVDRTYVRFLNNFRELQNLREFYFNLHDLEIEDFDIFMNVIVTIPSLTHLYVSMGSPNFEWKEIKKYSLLDLGSWATKITNVLKNLRVLFIDYPALTLESVNAPITCLQNVEFLSLNNKIMEKSKIELLLKSLNPEKLKAIYMGETALDSEKDLLIRLEYLTNFQKLENLTLKITLNKEISEEGYAYFVCSMVKLKSLKRLLLRIEKSVIKRKNWEIDLIDFFTRNRSLEMLYFYTKQGKIELNRSG